LRGIITSTAHAAGCGNIFKEKASGDLLGLLELLSRKRRSINGYPARPVANEAASRIKDTSIAPSREADTCSDETGGTKLEPVDEH